MSSSDQENLQAVLTGCNAFAMEDEPGSGGAELTWGLVVATYNRRDVLMRALRFAAMQTRKPEEIIIVDSSSDALETKTAVDRELAPDHPDTKWVFICSTNRSAAIQRNEGIEACTADIVFFIDDDCFMYRDYAERIMRVFEADMDRELRGLGGMVTDVEPDDNGMPPAVHKPARRTLWTRLRRRAHFAANHYLFMNSALSHFFPYTGKYPDLRMPALDTPHVVKPIRMFAACRAAFPRQALIGNGFDPHLRRYSAAEDLDICYRISLGGPLAMVHDAMICHRHHPSMRPNQATISAVTATNIAFFIQKHNPTGHIVKAAYYSKMLLRAITQVLFDVREGNLSFPRTRGTLLALRHIPTIFSMTGEELTRWYVEFQETLYRRGQTGSMRP